MNKKKSIIVIAAILAALVAVYFLWFRKNFTVKGVVASITGLTDSEREALKAAAESEKKYYKQLESTKSFVDYLEATYGYSHAKAIVNASACNLNSTEVFSDDLLQHIESELKKR